MTDHDEELTLTNYTFMGWDMRGLHLLPYSYGEEFPAFLTYRGGVDKDIIDEMRSEFSAGVRPERYASFLLESNAKEYMRRYIRFV